MKIDVEINLDSVEKILNKRGLEDYGKVQKFLDKRILEHSEIYMPKDNGFLYTSALISTKFGSGIIHYNTPYAHYMYEGILYVDPKYGKGAFFSEGYGFWSRKDVKKIPTQNLLNYQGGGLRGKKWVERMWANKKSEIIAEIEAYINMGVK